MSRPNLYRGKEDTVEELTRIAAQFQSRYGEVGAPWESIVAAIAEALPPKDQTALIERLVERGLGSGCFDDDNDGLWLEVAKLTGRDPETGNKVSKVSPLVPE